MSSRSIFDLDQSAAELPSLNMGMSKLTYQQVPPTRDVIGAAFPNGSIHLRWENSGVRWWIPSKSYIRLRCNFFKADGTTQPVIADDVAPNMGMAASLFQSGEFRIGDKTVSRVSDYMAQVDAVQKRLGKSKSWLDSQGKDLEQWDHSFARRQQEIVSDGYIQEEKSNQDIIAAGVTPAAIGMDPLTTIAITAATKLATFAAGAGATPDIINGPGILHVGDRLNADAAGNFANQVYVVTRILTTLTCNVEADNDILADIAAEVLTNFTFSRLQDQTNNESSLRSGVELIWQPPLSIFKVEHAMPTGKYELILNPQNSSSFRKRAIESLVADQDAPADFDFAVVDMYLYLATVEGPSVDTLSYFMSLEETRCQTIQVDNSAGLQQKNFDVSPATYALTVAFQSTDLSDTRNSASKFKFAAPDATVPSGELDISRFYLQYNGENKPSPDSDMIYTSPQGFINSRYAETLLYSDAYNDNGGGESRNDWLNRGMYMYYAYPKDGSSESTRVNVNYQFRTAPANGLANVLLFDHHKKMVLISIVAGRVVDVIEQDG